MLGKRNRGAAWRVRVEVLEAVGTRKELSQILSYDKYGY
jgi:hypothetical protein